MDVRTISNILNSSKVKAICQEQIVPIVENDIRTFALPDIEISVNGCCYEREFDDKTPVYQVDFFYTSQTIDDYYEAAIKSEEQAKRLLMAMKSVGYRKNKYENQRQEIEGIDDASKQIVIEIRRINDYEIVIRGKSHAYKIFIDYGSERLYIDNKKIYEDNEIKPNFDYFEYKYRYKNNKTPTYDTYPYYNKSQNKYDNYDDGYDDGYNAIFEDGDYDLDRYDEDDDYQMGVDDALDELGEDY